MRDLEPYIDRAHLPLDALWGARHPPRPVERLAMPLELVATRAGLPFWLGNMLLDHRYSWAEAARVCGWTSDQVREKASEFHIQPASGPSVGKSKVRVLPYP